MIRSAKFWIPVIVFQTVFGLGIFTITRHYYMQVSDNLSPDSSMIPQPPLVQQDRIVDIIEFFDSSKSTQSTTNDPVEISRQADIFFNNKQYNRAAELYAQLLALDPKNVGTYNNLGITLHYLGRSTEALQRLNEGVVVDPTYQRIWLTLGFVNIQVGNTKQARSALTTATQLDADNVIGQSAANMLEELP